MDMGGDTDEDTDSDEEVCQAPRARRIVLISITVERGRILHTRFRRLAKGST
jgi:hypothetical protein